MEDLNAALTLEPSNALALRFRGGVNSAIGCYQVRLAMGSCSYMVQPRVENGAQVLQIYGVPACSGRGGGPRRSAAAPAPGGVRAGTPRRGQAGDGRSQGAAT